ncbi:hypothetical protein HZC09_04370 [Candidatus Micrarchaeota archaeon]|nr:hypothetical protein [Candidatus Micrarchaeota archaeon]
MLRLLEKLQELKEKKTIEGAIITHFAHYKTGHGTMRATVYLEPRKNEPAELWESRVAALVEGCGSVRQSRKRRK